MTKTIALLCVLLSLFSCFLAAGYATVTDSLLIWGTANIEAPSGLFITKIERVGNSSGLDVENISFTPNSTTVECSLSKRSGSTAGSVSYAITVRNNTKRVYTFRKLYYQSDLSDYNNDKITTSAGRNNLGVVVNYPKANGENQTIGPGEELTFEVTYSLGASSSSFPSRNTYKTLINYQFGINVGTETEAVEVVLEKFKNILNTTDTYEDLVDVLDNKYNGWNEWTSNYVGNVGNATSDDAVAVNTLFAGQLELYINGETKPATVLIKHENLDGRTDTGDDYVAQPPANSGNPFYGYGCEMTLYLTTHSLKKSDSTDGNAPVYVAVFTCNRDANGDIEGGWYQVGDIYEGWANIVGYNGEADGEGSFVTDNWMAYNRTYQVTDNYSYTVDAYTSIKTIATAVDSYMITEFQRVLNEAKALIEDNRYAGVGIEKVEIAYSDALKFCTYDAEGNAISNPNITQVQLCPILRKLYNAVESAKDKIAQLPTE